MEDKEKYPGSEINLADYFFIIKKRRWLISIITAVSVAAAGVYSFTAAKIYQAKAVIIPTSQQGEQGNMNTLAMQFGMPVPSSSSASVIISLLESNILMEKVIRKNDLIPVFFGEGIKDNPGTDRMWDGIRYLKDISKVTHNKTEGIIEISVEYRDPKIAAGIINYMLSELTDYMSSEAKRVAETNRNYLESIIDRNSDPLIRQNIYSLIARQIEMSMMAEVKENFAFRILDPPRVPDKKIKPRETINMAAAFVMSPLAGVILVFFMEYFEAVRRRELQKSMQGSKR